MTGLLALIVIGAAAGFIATRLMGMDLPLVHTVAIGIIGALLGGLALRIGLAVLGAAAGFVGAVLGAVVLLWAYKTFLADR
ncbi:MAG: GlsB/YeaQ/YmgE family stress response membrane protein [Pseudomonadota bacterium]